MRYSHAYQPEEEGLRRTRRFMPNPPCILFHENDNKWGGKAIHEPLHYLSQRVVV